MSGGTAASVAGVMMAPSFAYRDGRVVTERSAKRVASFEARGKSLTDRLLAEVVIPEEHPARARFAQAGQRFDELGLAVAVDAGDAHDLACADVEAQVIDRGQAAIVHHLELLHPQQSLPRLGRRLLDAQSDLASDHQLGELLLAHPGTRNRCYELAAPEHADPVGYVEHLVQLVADEDDRHPFARQRS